MIRHQPLRVQVADHLRKEIISRYKPGDRLPTEADLAKRMGVSLLTLRDALATLAGDDLVVRQQGRGTFVGDGVLLAQGKIKSGRVGVLVELDIAHPRTSAYYVQVCQSIRKGLHDAGIDGRLYAGFVAPDTPAPMDTTSVELHEDVSEGNIAALIAIAGVPHMKIFDRLRAAGIPVIGDSSGFDYRIVPSYPSRIELAVKRFAELGRKRVAAVVYDGSDRSNLIAAITSAKLTVNEDWLKVGRHPVEQDAGLEPLLELWESDPDTKPDALFVGDDYYVSDIVRGIERIGVAVPDDLHIIAHANAGARASTSIPMEWVEIDPQVVADRYVQTVVQILAGETDIPSMQLVPFELIRSDQA